MGMQDVSLKEVMYVLVVKINERLNMFSSHVIGKWDPSEKSKSKNDV